jgi:hypothetical protein
MREIGRLVTIGYRGGARRSYRITMNGKEGLFLDGKMRHFGLILVKRDVPARQSTIIAWPS